MSLVKMKRPRKALFGYKTTVDSYDLKTVCKFIYDALEQGDINYDVNCSGSTCTITIYTDYKAVAEYLDFLIAGTEILHYGKYKGTVEWIEDGANSCWHGKVLLVDDLVTYEGCFYEDLVEAFKESVDDYIKTKRGFYEF